MSEKITTKKCLMCGYVWDAKVENPKQCPACKRMEWNGKKFHSKREPTFYSCNVCGHEWKSYKEEEPNECPACKSTEYYM